MEKLPGIIVVLGSPNSDQGELSEMGRGRVDCALQKFSEKGSLGWKVLLTGGFGEHFNRTTTPNAEYAKKLLVAQGVPEAAFVEFALSRNTVDDALQSRPIIERYNPTDIVVVSSDFHIPRVEFVFRSVFPDRTLTFAGAPYIGSRPSEERERLVAHEQRELTSLRERGESIVGGVLSVNSWRHSQAVNFPMSFGKTFYSEGSKVYADVRPGYPSGLFEYLAARSPSHQLAWDCGCGSGQSAVGLSKYFSRVAATDINAEQIAHAQKIPKVEYAVSDASHVDLKDGSVDLVTSATAAHWFDLDKFYAEVDRVLRPNGLLAVWTYFMPSIEPALDAITRKYYLELHAGLYPAESQYYIDGYKNLPFPYNELTCPSFETSGEWDFVRFRTHLTTLTARKKFMQLNDQDPLILIESDLADLWGDMGKTRTVRFPLVMKLGRKES